MNITRNTYQYVLLVFLMLGMIVLSCDHSGDHHHHHHHEHHHHHHEHDHDHSHHHHAGHEHHNHQHESAQSVSYQQDKATQQPQLIPQVRQTQSHPHHHTNPKPSQFKMIQNKPHLLESLKLSPISVFFYGFVSTPEYAQFESSLPEYNSEFYSKLSTEVQFYFIPADKFNLTRPNPSLSIYRKINNGEWLIYKGIFEKTEIINWVLKNTVDPLKDLSPEEIDSFFVDSHKGFILLDFGQFHLLKPKIMIHEFCLKYDLLCGKVTHKNMALNMVIQLMRAQKQPGVPKLGFYNPKTQELQIYTKDPSYLTETQLMQLYSGHQSIIPMDAQIDVAKVIHPETEFIEIKEPRMDLQL